MTSWRDRNHRMFENVWDYQDMKSQEMQQQQPTSKNNKSERMVTSLSTKKKILCLFFCRLVVCHLTIMMM